MTDALLDQIAVGSRPGTSPALGPAAAVRARTGVYVVAARIARPKGPAVVGAWTVVSLRGNAAPVLVADLNASTHSTWTSMEEFPQYGVPLDSPVIQAARDCLGS